MVERGGDGDAAVRATAAAAEPTEAATAAATSDIGKTTSATA